ncbi:MAG: prepilin-type N-terminal cleavage/methylation domain-containing protein [bacterium]|nr:prepilin-type N-terminal cleavage/methylation domain-containing protein [bacterium]
MKTKQFLLPSNKSGVSMIEVLVAASITVILVTIVFSLMIEGTRTQDFLSQQSDAINTAQKGMETIDKSLREAVNGDNGQYALVELNADSITFFADTDNDNQVEQIQYYLDGNNLMQLITEPSLPPVFYNPANSTTHLISDTVVNYSLYSNPIFEYYNKNYPADTTNNPLVAPIDLTEVTLIKVHLDVNADPNRIPETTTVETFIQLRNISSSL